MSRQTELGRDDVPDEQNNIYWFLRFLAAADFGSFAVKEPEATRTLGKRLETKLADDATLEELKDTISSGILDNVDEYYQGNRTKRYSKTEDLVDKILLRIEDREDVRDFQSACNPVVKTTQRLAAAPEFDEDTMQEIVEGTLLSEDRTEYEPGMAYHALESVDEEGTYLQAGGQNQALVPYIESLIVDDSIDSERNRARLISAVAQEYERRAGNKRKSDAGGVLETALNMVFDAFNVPVTGEPRHFDDFEIDNMLITDEATVGFSCKRTLRERFRQSLTREAEIDIDEVWFVPLSTDDISEDKIKDIQNDGGRVYVPRDSFQWDKYGDTTGIDALRPGDNFLYDLEEFAGIDLDTSVN